MFANKKNLIPHTPVITKIEREKLNKHKAFCIWFTGLSGSGKTTLAKGLEHELYKLNIHSFLLDGDVVRTGLNKDLGFSDKDRTENIRRIGEISKLFSDAGMVVITAFISPFKKDRTSARRLFKNNTFIEIYVKCSLEDCEERDPKKLYKNALAGKIKNFTGISSVYEPPVNPEIILENGNGTDINKNIDTILKYLYTKKVF